MAAATIDYSSLFKGLPPGAWVAISEDNSRVVAYAADLQTVIEMARQKGEDHPLVLRVPEQAGMLFL